ncbi:hypothetical protein [Spirochaeta dissipatitropha]
MKTIQAIQPLNIINRSPDIVLSLNKIRFELEKRNDDQYNEICWFLREYPRIFRHHLECFVYRLGNVHAIYVEAHKEFTNRLNNHDAELPDVSNCNLTCEEYGKLKKSKLNGMALSNIKTKVMYWEFESLLSSANISLDITARILSTAFKEQLPPNFNKACKNKNDTYGIISFLNSEKDGWVSKMKDYRDCFIHYTPVDTVLSIEAIKLKNKWFIYGKLPINPNERDITRFEFNYDVDVLKYSVFIYEKILNLDKEISLKLLKMYDDKIYPVRTNGLFNIGRRE